MRLLFVPAPELAPGACQSDCYNAAERAAQRVLIAEMRKAIASSDAFIASMQ